MLSLKSVAQNHNSKNQDPDQKRSNLNIQGLEAMLELYSTYVMDTSICAYHLFVTYEGWRPPSNHVGILCSSKNEPEPRGIHGPQLINTEKQCYNWSLYPGLARNDILPTAILLTH
jgi:hypothetical protein